MVESQTGPSGPRPGNRPNERSGEKGSTVAFLSQWQPLFSYNFRCGCCWLLLLLLFLPFLLCLLPVPATQLARKGTTMQAARVHCTSAPQRVHCPPSKEAPRGHGPYSRATQCFRLPLLGPYYTVKILISYFLCLLGPLSQLAPFVGL